jgi:hypothetical protein
LYLDFWDESVVRFILSVLEFTEMRDGNSLSRTRLNVQKKETTVFDEYMAAEAAEDINVIVL